MKVGVVFPQTEIGADPAVVRDYAQTAEGLGYSHLLAYDHVLGAGIDTRPEWRGPYTSETLFHEPFVLFGYLAGITQRLGLVSGVIVLPQRQTALVAKQAAEVDVLSDGRLRLGVGIGWNAVEYEALGEDFHNRGKRMEEQIAVMRELWTKPVVDFEGRWHRIPHAGLNPLPVQRPIPVWLGSGLEDKVLERVARIADGWMPQIRPDEVAADAIRRLREFVRQAGRDPGSIGIEARINLRGGSPDTWLAQLEGWRDLGATYASINTMRMDLDSPQAHTRVIREFASLALGE